MSREGWYVSGVVVVSVLEQGRVTAVEGKKGRYVGGTGRWGVEMIRDSSTSKDDERVMNGLIQFSVCGARCSLLTIRRVSAFSVSSVYK